jgi:simple sugar transport system ATP-binding protein
VLRGGKQILDAVSPDSLDDAALVDAMVGRTVAALPRERTSVPAERTVALSLEKVSVVDRRRGVLLDDIDLEVRGGELVGIAGVAGNGQLPLYEVALGLRPPTSGTCTIAGTALTRPTPRKALAAGAFGVPEDPVRDAVVPGLSVHEHVALDSMSEVRKGLGIDWARVAERYEQRNGSSGLRAADGRRKLESLSGGNIQRVMLVRALMEHAAALVVAAYPSRGLDIATTRRTQELLLERRAAGAGVLLISEDIDELLELCDRVAVVRNGRIVGVVDPKQSDRYEIGRLMLDDATDAEPSDEALRELAAVPS